LVARTVTVTPEREEKFGSFPVKLPMPLSQTRKRVGLVLKVVSPMQATDSRQTTAEMDALRTRWEIRAIGEREAAYRRYIAVEAAKGTSRCTKVLADRRDGHCRLVDTRRSGRDDERTGGMRHLSTHREPAGCDIKILTLPVVKAACAIYADISVCR
jgi:hypothetical protein